MLTYERCKNCVSMCNATPQHPAIALRLVFTFFPTFDFTRGLGDDTAALAHRVGEFYHLAFSSRLLRLARTGPLEVNMRTGH